MAGGARFSLEAFFMPNLTLVANGWFATAMQLSEMDEGLEEVTKLYSAEISENFEVGGRPAWPGLEESTIDRKSREPGLASDPGHILVRSGELWDEVSSPEAWNVSRQGQQAVAELEGGPAHQDYGHFHITGASSGSWSIPIRDYTIVPDSVDDDALDVFDEWVGSVLETALRW